MRTKRLAAKVGSLVLLTVLPTQAVLAQDFIVGGDVSSLRAVMDNGGAFYDSSESEDALQIMKEHGFNWVRAKLWHTPYTEATADPDAEKPVDPYNNLDDVVQTAVEAKANGLKFLLDFHYSDTWADPGRQYKPEAWASITDINVLADSVYNYTYAVMNRMKTAGGMPDMVQLGNEIRQGMLWPQGNIYSDLGGWNNLGQLLRAGVQAVRDVEAPGDTVLIMIHVDNGSVSFYQNVLAQNVHVDVWGYSYYPQWRGDLDNLVAAMEALDAQFPDQKVVIAETAYLWTTEYPPNDPKGDVLNWNPAWGDVNTLDGYPISPEGQRLFLIKLRNIMQNLPNGRGWGVFYWEPAWIPDPTYGSPMDNATLFDWDGNALISIDGLATDTTYPPPAPLVNVTLQINTSTLWDTLKPNHILQLRGNVLHSTDETLPDGTPLTWDDGSRVLPENVGGDYWEVTFPLHVGDTLSYKYWAGFTVWDPTSMRLGYEGPVTASIDPSRNTRLIVAPAADTTFPLEYLNGSNVDVVDQYWRPWTTSEDSLVVGYRVNMSYLMLASVFDPDAGDHVGVYGNSPLPGGNQSEMLIREEYSVSGGSFWHGSARIARSALSSGLEHSYRFVIFGADGTPLEEDILRTVTLRESIERPDTTLGWVFFNDGQALSLPEAREELPQGFALIATYPNPFNSSVRISFELAKRSEIELAVYNLIGQRVATLVKGVRAAGLQQVSWDGMSGKGAAVPSGMYVVRLVSDGESIQRKILLVR